jgi:hypothetical protein
VFMKRLALKATCAISLSILLPSCSNYLDVMVSNPCENPAKVSFSGSTTPPPITSAQWHDQVNVPPFSAVRVNGVVADVNPAHVAFARVQVGGASPEIVTVPLDTEEPIPVLIRATAC